MDHDVNFNGNNASNNTLLAVTTLNNDIQVMWKDKTKMIMMMLIQRKRKLLSCDDTL